MINQPSFCCSSLVYTFSFPWLLLRVAPPPTAAAPHFQQFEYDGPRCKCLCIYPACCSFSFWVCELVSFISFGKLLSIFSSYMSALSTFFFVLFSLATSSLDCLDIFFPYQYYLRFVLPHVFALFLCLRKSSCLLLTMPLKNLSHVYCLVPHL